MMPTPFVVNGVRDICDSRSLRRCTPRCGIPGRSKRAVAPRHGLPSRGGTANQPSFSRSIIIYFFVSASLPTLFPPKCLRAAIEPSPAGVPDRRRFASVGKCNRPFFESPADEWT